MTVPVKLGWRLFFRALRVSRGGSLSQAAEWMYRLNVFARSIGRHPIADEIYGLKNRLVKYLYQHGYATEAVLHVKAFDCWGVWDGMEYVCDDECPKCGGTGIYRTEKLYAFRFDVDGQRYAWHQPDRLIDYPVELTESEATPFTEARRDEAILSLEDAWTGCCVVWWALLLHGVVADLMIFELLRMRVGHALWKPWQRWHRRKYGMPGSILEAQQRAREF